MRRPYVSIGSINYTIHYHLPLSPSRSDDCSACPPPSAEDRQIVVRLGQRRKRGHRRWQLRHSSSSGSDSDRQRQFWQYRSRIAATPSKHHANGSQHHGGNCRRSNQFTAFHSSKKGAAKGAISPQSSQTCLFSFCVVIGLIEYIYRLWN